MKENRATLLCWHANNAGLEVLKNALDGLNKKHSIKITHVLYLFQKNQKPSMESLPNNDVNIEPVEISLSDPTAHREIYDTLRKKVLPYTEKLSGELHINISPGTPAMHSIWLILHAGGAFPKGTRLWSSQFEKETKTQRIDEVGFNISTYLAEIKENARNAPGLGIYNPEPRSPKRKEAFEKLKRYAMIPHAPLLILGERGTGKTRLVEQWVASLKHKKPKKVVTVPCGILDSEIADSFLFGHEKGAFTGAEQSRKGIMQEAHEGILFLDELQDLPPAAQRKLVRIFQGQPQRYRPLGSDHEKEVNVDLVCASNLSLPELRKRLDADLFDRVSHLMVLIPPLRECREDIKDDWSAVWREVISQEEEAPWSEELEKALEEHPLQGNMRDLQRLAMLVIAWDKKEISQAILEWEEFYSLFSSHTAPQPSCPHEQKKPTDYTYFFENQQGSREERKKLFLRELALWAKETYKTWKKAAKALRCDEKTLRDDEKYDHEK